MLRQALRRTIKYYHNHGLMRTLWRIKEELLLRKHLKANAPLPQNTPKSPQGTPESMKPDFFWPGVAGSHDTLKVSVIVPNYNHARYLVDRLESIYQQSYTNFEVLLLDDGSTDESVAILKSYQEKYPEKTQLLLNTQNSGSPFSQWLHGISAASGDVIWIAESDDWCDHDFLAKLLPFFHDESVMLAYCNTVFMQDGKKIWDIQSYLQAFPLDFTKSFVISAPEFVKQVMYCKNAIPNASSALFRKPLDTTFLDQAKNFKLCGDWYFYLSFLRGGVVAYCADTIDYYRIQQKSTSLLVQKTPAYYQEQYAIMEYTLSAYTLTQAHRDKKYQDITREFQEKYSSDPADSALLEKLYPVKELYKKMQRKTLNIGMCGYAFCVGGGEIFPIHLANALKSTGASVTYFDFCHDDRNPSVRKLLRSDIPVVIIPHNSPYHVDLRTVVRQLDLDILHSHHGVIDILIDSFTLPQKCHKVITLHGYYEAIEDDETAIATLQKLRHSVHFVRIADKSIRLLQKSGVNLSEVPEIRNGMPRITPHALLRSQFGIGEQDFVLCLASRALPSKGWAEAVEAVMLANKRSKRQIHLLLLGAGEMCDTLQKHPEKVLHSAYEKGFLEKKQNNLPEYIHVLGNCENLQNYYAMANMGFFPSYFSGESAPLVNIECLLTGTPIIATNIGEIPHQLTLDSGEVAGAIFDLEKGKVPIEKVAKLILEYASSEKKVHQAANVAKEKAQEFDITRTAQQYLQVYESLV